MGTRLLTLVIAARAHKRRAAGQQWSTNYQDVVSASRITILQLALVPVAGQIDITACRTVFHIGKAQWQSDCDQEFDLLRGVHVNT